MGVYKRKLKDCLRWRYGGSYKGKKYSSRSIYKTAEEAREAEQKFLAMKQQDTITRLARDRLQALKAQNANSDYYIDTQHKLNYAVESFGFDTLVSEITKREAREVVQKLAFEYQEEGLSTHPVNHFIRIMKAFFNWCIDERDMEITNPFQRMKLLPLSQKQKYIPTEDQVYRLRQKLNENEKALFRFVDETGCRIMEAINMTEEDIKTDTVILWTRKAKNGNMTPRTVPRPDSFHGKPFTTWTKYPRFLGEKVAKLKQEPTWNWHNLRHRRATKWAKEGKTTFEIMSRLGHNNLGTTMIYLRQLGIYRT